MRKLTLVSFLVLAGAGAATLLTEPDMASDVPVIYWSTDPNPAKPSRNIAQLSASVGV